MNYLKFNKTHISAIFTAQVSQIVFSAFLTALTLITTVWVEILKNSYQRDFSAEVS